MELQIIDTGKNTAAENMRIDEQMLQELDIHSLPILHFYDWLKPSATFGIFSHPNQWLLQEGIKKLGLDLAKRPTGGGIIFHSFDFAFSFLLSTSHPAFSLNTLKNYAFVNRIIATVLEKILNTQNHLELLKCSDCSNDKLLKNFCMATPTVYDVVYQGRKLAGGAQRRTKSGFLHQASIALIPPPSSFLNDILPADSPIASAMQHVSYPLLDHTWTPETLKTMQITLKENLISHFDAACMNLSR